MTIRSASYLLAHSALAALIVMFGGSVSLTAATASPGAAASGTSTGSQVTISSLAVDVWPEHDDPRLLVIYRGTLSANATPPQTLTFTIPTGGQVNAAAYRTDDGQLWSAPHQYRQEGDRLTVTFTTQARGFQFEYYVDAITGLPQRSFSLSLVFPADVENLQVSVEQPLRSSAFTLTPPAGGTTAAPGGFTRHLIGVGRLPAGKVWQVRANYQKADGNPSVPRTVPLPGADTAIPVRSAMPRWLWGAGAAALLSLAGAVVLGFRRRRTSGRFRATAPPKHPEKHTAKQDGRRASPDRIYCTNCGTRARPRDRFCSHCGKPLAQE